MSLEWVIETHESVPSTQDLVLSAARDGRAEGFVVCAKEQSSGRGRHGRVWKAGAGNLFLSLLLRPECRALDVGQLSLIAGLSLVEVIRELIGDGTGEQAMLKWPNDVLLDGRKCAGILLESELTPEGGVDFVVLGLGVNVAFSPVSYGSALGDYADVTCDDVQARFLELMTQYYQQWQESGFDALRGRWMCCAHEKGSSISVKIGTRLEKGSFHDIDAQGNLRLLADDGVLKTITSGEVYL